MFVIAVKDKIGFTYNGYESDNLGIANVNVETGMAEEPFLASNIINTVPVKGRTKPYFMGLTYTPMILLLSFGFLKPWDDDLIREVARMFHVDNYQPLWFHEYEDQIYYCIPTEESRLIHNSLREGYVELEFHCNDIYAYSRQKEKAVDSDKLGEFRINNQGDVEIYPEILLKSDDSGNDAIVYNVTNDIEVKFEDINTEEEIYIDNENEIIINQTDNELYRYNNHNDVFLKLERGMNKLQSSGIEELKFQWRFKTLQI